MVPHTTDYSEEIQKVARLIEAGRFIEARELAVSITRKHPGDAGAWYMLAGIYSRLEQLNEVIDCCRRVTRLSPDHAGAHYNLATGLQQAGQLSEAVLSYRQCLRIEPNNIPALLSLGKLLGKAGNYSDAL